MQHRLARIPAHLVNVRATATPTARILATLRVGDVVTLAQPIVTGDWVELTTAAGVHGYVSQQGGAVQFEAVAEAPPIPMPHPDWLIIDVSSNNGEIDWVRVKAAGVGMAYIRATMGGTGEDKRVDYNARGALNTAIVFGFYHLFRPDSEGLPQAKHALRITRAYHTGLPLAVDVEHVVAPKRTLTPFQYADQLAAFVQHIQAETGELPAIYTSLGEWSGLVGLQHDALFSQCKLWVAHFTNAPKPLLPRCWSTYWLWQWSSSGKVDGIKGRTDLNRAKE